jgi:hypothetical protein
MAIAAPDPQVPAQKPRRKLTAQYKLRILAEADRCNFSRQAGLFRPFLFFIDTFLLRMKKSHTVSFHPSPLVAVRLSR